MMAKSRMAQIWLAALLLVAVSVPMAQASKADVNIFNEVGETIVLHCKSGDTDLREHHVAAGGKYGWGFSPNDLRNTLYWCSFGWRNPAPVFDVRTDEGVLQQRSRPCTHCEWRVRGPMGSTETRLGSLPLKFTAGISSMFKLRWFRGVRQANDSHAAAAVFA